MFDLKIAPRARRPNRMSDFCAKPTVETTHSHPKNDDVDDFDDDDDDAMLLPSHHFDCVLYKQ